MSLEVMVLIHTLGEMVKWRYLRPAFPKFVKLESTVGKLRSPPPITKYMTNLMQVSICRQVCMRLLLQEDARGFEPGSTNTLYRTT